MHFFERSCPAGWVYPCSLQDIAHQLAQLPEVDIEGLWAVGLVASTRKDDKANARYFYDERPVIHVYSYPSDLRFRLRAHSKATDIEHRFAMELKYGMTMEREGSRVTCVWKAAALRAFIVEHVLLHEVGHHLYHRQRNRQGYAYHPRTVESEQFAEAYAVRRQQQSSSAVTLIG